MGSSSLSRGNASINKEVLIPIDDKDHDDYSTFLDSDSVSPSDSAETGPTYSSRFIRMNCKERTFFIFEALFLAFMQTLSGYYSFESVEFIDENSIQFKVLLILYILANAGSDIRSLYKFGPFEFNVSHLDGKANRINERFNEVQSDEMPINATLDEIEKNFFTKMEEDGKYLKPIDLNENNSVGENDEAQLKKIGLNQYNHPLGFFDWADILLAGGLSGVTGACAGNNINVIADTTSNARLILPICLGGLSLLIYGVIAYNIKRHQFVFPSNLMMQKILEQFNLAKEAVDNISKRQDKLTTEIKAEFSSTISTQKNAASQNTPLIKKASSYQRDFDCADKAWQRLYIFVSLFPLFMSFVSMAIASQSQKSASPNDPVLIPLVASSAFLLIFSGLRIRQYHLEKIRKVEVYNNFHVKYSVRLKNSALNLFRSEEKLQHLKNIKEKLSAPLDEKNEGLKSCHSYSDLHDFVSGKIALSSRVFHITVLDANNWKEQFEKYLQENKLENTQGSLVRYCQNNPMEKARLNEIYSSYKDEQVSNAMLFR